MTVALLPTQSITKGFRHLSQVITATVSQTRGIVASLVLEVEQLLGVPAVCGPEIERDKIPHPPKVPSGTHQSYSLLCFRRIFTTQF